MAIIQGNAKQGSVRGFYPKVINGSLRFNKSDNAYLEYDIVTTGDPKTWTFSCWFKICTIANDPWYPRLFDVAPAATANRRTCITVHLESVGFQYYDGSTNYSMSFPHKYRDPSAWYHMVFVYDSRSTTTSTDRLQMYINGERLTPSSATYPSDNFNSFANTSGNVMRLGNGVNDDGYDRNLDAYMANVHFIDGQALTASDFGETKNGVWVAKDYAGTFGTNGFYLTFEDDTQVEAFNTVLYRGNGGTQSITGYGFDPDFVWIKNRSNAYNHRLYDKIRGNSRALQSNQTNAESTYGAMSFESDGFSFTNDPQQSHNTNGDNYVAWGWKAGDSNVSNTDGSITSTVRANTTYGFSIVSYTGGGSAGTIGHGLSSEPKMLIVKRTDGGTGGWYVYHHKSDASIPQNKYLELQGTGAVADASWPWNDTAPTSSVFSVGSDINISGNGNTFIAYCWAEKAGYSKFGSYSGDNSTDGSNETTVGFKPAFVLIKNTGAGENWNIYDNTRFTDGDGYIEGNLFASSSAAEVTTAPIQFTDTGFAPRASGGGVNASGSTYIYAAFADTREAAFWLDQSGNDNDWQPVNLDHNDTVADSPTNNFATLNPLDEQGSANTLSDGNLVVNMAAAGSLEQTRATMGVSSGQFYWEAEVLSSGSDGGYFRVGFKSPDHHSQGVSSGAYWMVRGADGETEYMINGSASQGTSSVAYDVGDIIMVAVDMDAGKWWAGVNGTWVGDPVAGTGAIHDNLYGTVIPFVSNATSAATHVGRVNFGQQPFKYDPPA